ncbi:HXK3 protein, partial [Nothocercus nigrocapillus]|nr:HXK3 protein [Nothocercus nigrocapillus]
QVQRALLELTVSLETLQEVKGHMLEAMAKGLSQQTHAQATVHMLPTYVCSTPDGTEKGDVLVVELGHSHVRTLWVTLPGDGNQTLQLKDQLFELPEDIMQGKGEALFDFIAQCLCQFLDGAGLGDPQQRLPLGFVFPFSCRQTRLEQASEAARGHRRGVLRWRGAGADGRAVPPQGELLAWSKGFRCSDVEGHDVVQLLQAAINKQQRYHVNVVALMNNTVGTMMSCSMEGMPCEVGLVIDAGTNSCFMAEGCHVEMAEETSGRMCVNTEWGCFGDDGALSNVLTSYDQSVDQESHEPGHKRFEKLIGGLYLGEIVRHVLAKLAAEGALFSGAAAPALGTKDVLKTQQVLEIIDDETGLAAARSALQALGLAPSEQDCCHVQQLCRAVVTRAAGLCAAGLAAILSHMCQSRELERLKANVAVDGTVYRGHARFGEILQRITKLLAPECTVTLVPSVDGGGRGAAVVTAVALRLAAQRRELDQLLAPLRLSLADLQRVQALMRREMDLGLNQETNAQSSIRMLPTYVRNTPDGTGEGRDEGTGWRGCCSPAHTPCCLPAERGVFLALDLGGTNFRVLVVHVEQDGVHMASEIYAIPLAIMQGTGEALFDHIIDCITDFQQKQGLTGQVLPLGFTFSFPCQQLGLDKAVLLSWTKGFSASGCVGRDVVQMLREAAQRKQHSGLDVVAVVNDTVGTMMSCGYDDPSCEIGLIVGTGTNTCYMEEMKNVGTAEGDEGRMCINMEWGAFGDNGCLDDIFTDFDRMVDEKTINPGKQRWVRVAARRRSRVRGAGCAQRRLPAGRFEKLISGMYLGEIVRYILLALVERRILFRGKPSPKLQTRDIFQTKFLSTIEIDGLALRQVRGVLHELELDASFEDSVLVREVCQAVSLRAAQLCAAGLAAVAEKMRESRGLAQLAVTVGVDGTLYKMHPRFSQHLQRTLRDLAPKCFVTFLQSEDGSGKGAALVAAVHCRVAQAQGPQ